jgi:natural product biosynthesis luciferase-like monooxygenase protein
MKFGLNFFPSFRPSDCSTAEYFAQCLRLAARADQLGFNSIKTVEHYFFDYGGHSPNPAVFLAAVAARTTRIRLITGAVIPAFNHPLKLAAELAMLDNLSNGRLDAGFGRAFIPKEFAVFGVDMEESRARFEEGIDIVTRLWTEDRVSYEGRFHRLQDVHLQPRPVQMPHPPVWIASIASEESFVWAGRRGYNVMIVPYAGSMERVRGLVRAYRAAWREAGHPPGREQVQSSLHCYVAGTRQEAVEGARPRVERYIEVFSEAVSSWVGHRSPQYASYGRMVESIAQTTIESMLRDRQALIGAPDDVVEQLRYHAEVFGEFEPSLQINFGGTSEGEAGRTLELFARHVMPHFATAPAHRAAGREPSTGRAT